MAFIGYTLSSEEHDPITLVKNAQLAEQVGFDFLGISDHFHPWVDNQGQSPFVWNVIGALSQATKRVKVFIEVNCPIIQYHPAVVAQAAATSQYQLGGRFILGVGTGENLNEHIVGKGWPPPQIRLKMLKEAVEIMKKLWQGGYQSYFGEYFTVDAARIYTMPKDPVPIIISAMGSKAAEVAGKLGDGLVTTSNDEKVIQKFQQNGGKGKPMFIQFHVCFDNNADKAKDIAIAEWPNAGIPKPLNTELRLPQDFQNTSQLVSYDDVTQKVIVGADSQAVLKKIEEFQKAGFEYIYIHNIGPNQGEFLQWAKNEILPQINKKPQTKKSSQEKIVFPTAYSHKIDR